MSGAHRTKVFVLAEAGKEMITTSSENQEGPILLLFIYFTLFQSKSLGILT